MREIKFRAWDKRVKQMFIVTSLMYLDDEDIRIVVAPIKKGEPQAKTNPTSIDHFEVMQFTGLKDKNGKEIYEGDIVKYFSAGWSKKYQHIQEVKYTTERFTDAEYGYSMGMGFDVGWDEEEEPEIIGNIYENPELLNN